MQTSNRNEHIDHIRLIALIGICVVNVPFIALPEAAAFLIPDQPVDRWVNALISGLFQMKFFLLFSFVFGWSLVAQRRSLIRRGLDPERRYFTRVVWLFIFGFAHAILVFTGDILTLYALLSLLAWPLLKRPNVTLIRWAAGALILSAIGLIAIAILISELPPESLSHSPNMVGYPESVLMRLYSWPGTLSFLLLLQGPMAFGAFMLGVCAARSDFFSPNSPGRRWLIRHQWSLWAMAVVGNGTYAASMQGWLAPAGEWVELVGFVSLVLGAPSLAALYLLAIIHWCPRWHLPPTLQRAARNSLSSYVLQGVLAGVLFGRYGLGWFNQLSAVQLLPMSLAVALVAMILVGTWVQRFGQGPLEWLLRNRLAASDRPLKAGTEERY